MEKQKKWQFALIVTVILLTLYNILPTLFYYLKPLKSPLSETRALEIVHAMEKRAHQLEADSKDWIHSFCKLIRVAPQSIVQEGQNWTIRFAKSEEAARFRKYLPRAGSLIPFVPAQMGLQPAMTDDLKEVAILRRIGGEFPSDCFSYAKQDSPLYRELILDRAMQIGYALAGPSDAAYVVRTLDPRLFETLCYQIQSISDLEPLNKAAANRFCAGFTQGPFEKRGEAVRKLIQSFETFRDELKRSENLAAKEPLFIKAEQYLKNREALFASGQDPLTLPEIRSALESEGKLKIANHNPLFSEISIDWAKGEIGLKLQPDILPSKLEKQLNNEVARLSRISNESIEPEVGGYKIALFHLKDVSGLLVFDIEKFGKIEAERLLSEVKAGWHPIHPDLQNLSIVEEGLFGTLTPAEKALSLIVHSPSFGNRRLQVATNGIEHILKSYEGLPESEQASKFSSDFRSLASLLAKKGLSAYRGRGEELVFEKGDLYPSLLAATREDFQVRGTQKFAFLELSTLEQRLMCDNRIDTAIHEDLVKWRDEYNAAQVSIQSGALWEVPKPTKSALLSNMALSWRKIFRGDDKKVIHWGLDLSGGKTVQVELRDASHQIVTSEEEIKQGINELYSRVNKMGVSEVSIRQLGHQIAIDFPASQHMSASELIKASSMHFHVVNEKFSSPSSPLAAAAQTFLQEVWNEAVVTNKKEDLSVGAIAWKHLHAETPSESAKTLLASGLILQSPEESEVSFTLDDTVSKIALIRGEQNQWFGQSHPLLFVFRNYTLEGSQLGAIHASYDPQKGNFLSFEVIGSMVDRSGQTIHPRNQLHSWTSRYAKEKILGTALEEYSRGSGWRMAVILNGTVISAPTLEAVIRDSATISGKFSQREVNQLAADLKAGSLSYTPHILSEKNVSPELGIKDRVQGITATIFALILVVIAMIGYYRFAGLIASIAVLFNLLILWATLQNIGATLSLAGIAGIILTVGMAVDANVLVFERIKEEYAHSNNIGSAIAAGYQKAYSAIVDSNVTTIIAALILLNFDAGPIKGFAITLIIGIVSSMFTALFMTKYYFTGWAQRAKEKTLHMSGWIQATSIDFLKRAKLSFGVAALIIAVGGALVFTQRASIFGMDFTGGFSVEIELEPNEKSSYLQIVSDAFEAQGVKSADFQVRELSPANHLRLLFSSNLEQPGKAFFGMSYGSETGTNARIAWMLSALKAKGIALTEHSMDTVASNWTAMSGQMSDSMRNNALLGLFISFVCIFIYIAFRFEYKFAAASILCLLHDVLITLGLMGIFHFFKVPVQIDLNTIAAIMTIVGYSLNDKIIVFDRIREEMRLSKHKSLHNIVNHSLNATLSRTTITSGTTLLVLLALVILGGPSIFSFALVMTIGVIFGTLSSWYIASPLMLFFHGREEGKIVKSA